MRLAALVVTVLVTVTGCFGSVEGEDQPCGVVACDHEPGPTQTETQPPPKLPQRAPQATTNDAGTNDAATNDAAAADTTCPEPYHGRAPDGRCVWSCSIGTQPDDATSECVCQGGLKEVDTDDFGRRVCR